MARPGERVEPIPEIDRREERMRAEQEKKAWKPPNVVLYGRVSDPHQVKEGSSLTDQRRHLLKYCKSNGFTILDEFEEGGKSAWKNSSKRPAFQRMIQFCLENSKDIYAVVVYDTDRGFRDAAYQGFIRNQLADVGIKFKSPNYDYPDRPNSGEMMNAAENQGFAEKLSKRMKQAREDTLEKGKEAGRVSIGYLQTRPPDRSRGSVIEQDPERAPIIAEAIEAFVYSSRTRQSLHKWAIEKGLTSPKTGLPIPRNSFLRIFENPKYGGIQRTASGEYVKSVHPQIVSEETMRLSIAKALGGDPARRVPHDRNLDGIPLRQVLCCPVCSKRLSGSVSTGKMREKYGYYHLPRHEPDCSLKKLRLPSLTVNEAFLDVLERLRVEPVVFDLLEVFVRDRQRRRIVSIKAEADSLNAERDKIRTVLDGLVDKYAEGKLADDAYNSAVSRNEDALSKVESRLEDLKSAALPLDNIVFRAATALEHPDVTWSLLSDDERNRMAYALFPDGICFDANMKPVMVSQALHGGMIALARKPVWRSKTWRRKKPTKKALGVKP